MKSTLLVAVLAQTGATDVATETLIIVHELLWDRGLVMTLQEKVFAFDGRIRFCGVLDGMGRLATGGMRPGLESLEPDEEAERIDVQMAVSGSMLQSASPYLGKTNFIVAHRDRMMLIAFPKEKGATVLVTAEPDLPLEEVKSLRKVVDENYPSA